VVVITSPGSISNATNTYSRRRGKHITGGNLSIVKYVVRQTLPLSVYLISTTYARELGLPKQTSIKRRKALLLQTQPILNNIRKQNEAVQSNEKNIKAMNTSQTPNRMMHESAKKTENKKQ